MPYYLFDRGFGILPSDLVNYIKGHLGITNSNEWMAPEEIKKVMRWIGQQAADTVHDDGKPVVGKIGISAQLCITLMVFPDYYFHYELWQRN